MTGRDAPSAPVLELSGATLVKGDRAVLNRLTLTIPQGEHTAILGPNGAGKSMLLALLTHYERPLAPEDGTAPVRVFGEENWNVFDLRSQLGIVSADLHQRFVAGNNEGRITGEAAVLSGFLASHGLLRYGTVTREMRSRAARALEAAGASHLAGRQLDQMSSGEARRVLLARALVTDPRALVLDEPTTGLDLAARHAFMEQIRAIARAGATIILITHHVDEVFPEISRVVLLREGRIAAEGTTAAMMTSARLTELFGLAVDVQQSDGYYSARPRIRSGTRAPEA